MGNERMGRTLSFILPILAIGLFSNLVFYLVPKPRFDEFPYAWFPSQPAAYAFVAVMGAWVLCEIINIFWSSMNSTSADRDMGSYWVVIGATYAAMVVVYVSRSLGVWAFDGILQYAGLAVSVAGIVFREWSIFVLGRHFTVKVRVREKAELITAGPYRYLRHPSYTGGMMVFIGAALALGSLPGLLFMVVLLAAYDYRMRVEEKALQEAFGTKYEEYKKRTWKVFPGF
jgi:protein-S-isoprenylcysteine O-methyltransferase Ste14